MARRTTPSAGTRAKPAAARTARAVPATKARPRAAPRASPAAAAQRLAAAIEAATAVAERLVVALEGALPGEDLVRAPLAGAFRAALTAEPSGAAWCARFPTSRSLDDLAEPFQDEAKRFVGALEKAGARVSLAATFRPEERAWLMHWCWEVGKNHLDPRQVPARPGLPIDWVHRGPDGGPDLVASRSAALDMVEGYGMAFPAAIQSRHTQRRAIDMSVRWDGTLRVLDANGGAREIGAPRDGSNPALHAVGASYGVVKLVRDPPHWSDDGH